LNVARFIGVFSETDDNGETRFGKNSHKIY